MQGTYKPWTTDEQKSRTRLNQYAVRDRMRFVDNVREDSKRDKRTKEQICKKCCYEVRMAFQAFTSTQCGKCKKDMTFSNGDVDWLCFECAIETKSCKHCGGEMD